MRNIPSVTLGLVAVSRDCFPVTLSESRRARVAAACCALALPIYAMSHLCGNGAGCPASAGRSRAHGINTLCV